MRRQPDSEMSLMNLAELERLQCSCELHDGVLQFLIGARMELETIRHQVQAGKAVGEEQIVKVEKILKRGIREGRDWIGRLRGDSFYEKKSIVESINSLIQDARQSNEAMEIVAQVDPGIDKAIEDTELCLATYRIVQESLRNALRYAQATQIQVHLRLESGQLMARIADNGRGFDPATVARDHFGILGMRTRAAMTSGIFQLESAQNRGTIVSVTWPFPRVADKRGGESCAS
jgi:signal transduction histidine kinase